MAAVAPAVPVCGDDSPPRRNPHEIQATPQGAATQDVFAYVPMDPEAVLVFRDQGRAGGQGWISLAIHCVGMIVVRISPFAITLALVRIVGFRGTVAPLTILFHLLNRTHRRDHA